MESSKYLCVRNIENKSITVVEVETQAKTIVEIDAESAIMNPTTNILAVRNRENNLQIFCVEPKVKLAEHTMTESVVFWKWISHNTIAIVTPASVFHWCIEFIQEPYKVFDRHERLESASIVDYRVNSTEKWFLLVGMTHGADEGMQRVIQLYNSEKCSTTIIEGHTATFVKFELGSSYTVTLLAIASNTKQGGNFTVEVLENNPKPLPKFERRMASKWMEIIPLLCKEVIDMVLYTSSPRWDICMCMM